MHRKGLGVFDNKIVKVDNPLNLEPGKDVIIWDIDDYKPPGEAIKEAGLKVVLQDKEYFFVRI